MLEEELIKKPEAMFTFQFKLVNQSKSVSSIKKFCFNNISRINQLKVDYLKNGLDNYHYQELLKWEAYYERQINIANKRQLMIEQESFLFGG